MPIQLYWEGVDSCWVCGKKHSKQDRLRKGLCGTHYFRERKWGNPRVISMLGRGMFLENVDNYGVIKFTPARRHGRGWVDATKDKSFAAVSLSIGGRV